MAVFSTWEARDWEELRSVWSELAPVNDEMKPRFKGVELVENQPGYLFQRWVMEAFRLCEIEGDYPYRVGSGASKHTLEELDGLIYDGWQGFIVESKFTANQVDIDPIFRLHIMAEQRPVGTLGLFFSASGYKTSTIELVDRLRPIRVLLFERKDLDWAVQNPAGMMKMVH